MKKIITVIISFLIINSIFGSNLKSHFIRNCNRCMGSGEVWIDCPECSGSANGDYVITTGVHARGRNIRTPSEFHITNSGFRQPCRFCGNTVHRGKVKSLCPSCRGTGLRNGPIHTPAPVPAKIVPDEPEIIKPYTSPEIISKHYLDTPIQNIIPQVQTNTTPINVVVNITNITNKSEPQYDLETIEKEITKLFVIRAKLLKEKIESEKIQQTSQTPEIK